MPTEEEFEQTIRDYLGWKISSVIKGGNDSEV